MARSMIYSMTALNPLNAGVIQLSTTMGSVILKHSVFASFCYVILSV
jgi:hypothetical protein